mmetsp:Transcript_31136/g.81611  ORF Transcript_31136/g.81611 Transcript_31136/m.81611 type:complete len:201 (-) Transcript_31136:224-826(-)
MSCCAAILQLFGLSPDPLGHTKLNERLLPSVLLDHTYAGEHVVLVKGGTRVCGSGGAIGNAPLNQNKSYWEVKLQTSGLWNIGVAARQANLNSLPLGETSLEWVLRSDGGLYHKGERVMSLPDTLVIEEGDIIALSYDHSQLSFYVNGDLLAGVHFTSVRGSVYPVVGVDQGAILDVAFKDFSYDVPVGFSEIMMEQNII